MSGTSVNHNNKINDPHMNNNHSTNNNHTNNNINILLNLDEKSYTGGEHPDYHPITWFHEYDGGRSFYTGLGHTKDVYEDDRFIKLLEKGILYASYEVN